MTFVHWRSMYGASVFFAGQAWPCYGFSRAVFSSALSVKEAEENRTRPFAISNMKCRSSQGTIRDCKTRQNILSPVDTSERTSELPS